MEILISIIAGVLLVEAYAWLPTISKWMLERAVKRVCPEVRERCREEWMASLDALPNTILKFAHAVSYIATNAPGRINADTFEAECDEIDVFLRTSPTGAGITSDNSSP